MKRLLLALCLIAVPAAAIAFDTTPRPERVRADRVALVRTPLRDGDAFVHDAVRRALERELRARGFDAFDANATFDELARDDAFEADYIVEITAGDADLRDYGGVDVGTRAGAVSLGVVAARVAAEVRVYDGRSLRELGRQSLAKKQTAILPTGVGVGGRAWFAEVALPFVERAQLRSVAAAAAREAAAAVTDVVRGE
ncbi:MAG TPA: hypothetical protein VF824_11970 [Thermoanaerobaculia bacterium]|jgi:hypothetical protein